jgi:hypothetical protein
MTPAALLTLGSLLALSPAALAQSGPPPQQQGGPAPAGAEANDRWPVFAITSVEVVHTKSKPEISAVVVRGVTSSEGWEHGELVPLQQGTAPDGVLDLVFVADAPSESSAASGLATMHAVLPLAPDHPFKAVRIRGATNTVLLSELHGIVEVKPPQDPCHECVGRYLVAKGGKAPAGVPASQTLSESDLPPYARIIRASDGIADMAHNPNRLTIMVGEDGRIVSASWE